VYDALPVFMKRISAMGGLKPAFNAGVCDWTPAAHLGSGKSAGSGSGAPCGTAERHGARPGPRPAHASARSYLAPQPSIALFRLNHSSSPVMHLQHLYLVLPQASLEGAGWPNWPDWPRWLNPIGHVQPRLAVRPMGFVRSSDLADRPIVRSLADMSRELCVSHGVMRGLPAERPPRAPGYGG